MVAFSQVVNQNCVRELEMQSAFQCASRKPHRHRSFILGSASVSQTSKDIDLISIYCRTFHPAKMAEIQTLFWQRKIIILSFMAMINNRESNGKRRQRRWAVHPLWRKRMELGYNSTLVREFIIIWQILITQYNLCYDFGVGWNFLHGYISKHDMKL